VNGDELRFPSADVELGVDSTYEFAAIWPDCPPATIVSYAIRIPIVRSTVKGWSVSGRMLVNLHGEMGDIGFRPLNSASAICLINDDPEATNHLNTFEDWSINSFEVEVWEQMAISITSPIYKVITGCHNRRDITARGEGRE